MFRPGAGRKGIADRDPPTISECGIVQTPWLERPIKERRAIQRKIELIRKTQGLAAARLAWFRAGKPMSDEMLKVLEQDDSLKRV